LDALFENKIALAFLEKNEVNALKQYLRTSEWRLCNGRTQDEVDAVEKRVERTLDNILP